MEQISIVSSPKVIFLDWNKTLSDSLFWSQLGNESHLLNPHHAGIIKYLFGENKDLIPQWMRGNMSAEDICIKISNGTGINSDIIFTELIESCRNMEFCDTRVTETIKKIKSTGRKVVIATDNMDTFTRFTVPAMNLNILFDDILNSFDLGVLKEDSENGKLLFFENYMQKNTLDYSEVILFDDSPDRSGVYEMLGFARTLITGSNHFISELEKYTK